MTLGKLAADVASMLLRSFARHSSWFSRRLRPLAMSWLGVIAQIRPCFFSVGHWSGVVNSIDLRPIFAQTAAN